MESKRIINISVYSIAAIAVISLLWWIYTDPTNEYKTSEPGADNRGKGLAAQEVKIGDLLEQYSTEYFEISCEAD